MKIRAEMGRQRAPLWPYEYQVDKVVELPNTAFVSLMMQPLHPYDFIECNRIEPHQDDGITHCLLFLSDDRTDGVLVQCGDDGRAMYSAYVAGARDVVQARLDRVADFILRECIENRGAESWQAHFNDRPACGSCRVSFQELEKELGLTIREGNGLDAMLLDALRRRPEVSTVELSDGCIDTDYDLSPGKGMTARKENAPVYFTSTRKAQMFENAVSTVCEIFEDDDLYTMLHNSFGMTLQEIRAGGYMSDREIAQTCGVPEELLDCDMTVRDILKLDGICARTGLACDGSDYLAPLKKLKNLTPSAQEDLAALMDARVVDIRIGDGGETELVLEGVEAAELDRLYDAIEDQGQAMGPTMG